MAKIRINADAWIYPLPTILLGANVNGKPNYNVVGNCGIMSLGPPVVYVSSGVSHHTNIGIRENGTYSINIPSTSMARVTDYCGLVSGSETDKSALFTSFYGSLGTAPMIEECPISLECKVIQTLTIHEMEVFIADVVEAYAREDCLVDGRPDMGKVDPMIYAFMGNYWSVGQEIARAFGEGEGYEP